MELPIIELASLPDLNTLNGVFGSLSNPLQGVQSDDTIVVMMVYVYNVVKKKK